MYSKLIKTIKISYTGIKKHFINTVIEKMGGEGGTKTNAYLLISFYSNSSKFLTAKIFYIEQFFYDHPTP